MSKDPIVQKTVSKRVWKKLEKKINRKDNKIWSHFNPKIFGTGLAVAAALTLASIMIKQTTNQDNFIEKNNTHKISTILHGFSLEKTESLAQ